MAAVRHWASLADSSLGLEFWETAWSQALSTPLHSEAPSTPRATPRYPPTPITTPNQPLMCPPPAQYSPTHPDMEVDVSISGAVGDDLSKIVLVGSCGGETYCITLSPSASTNSDVLALVASYDKSLPSPPTSGSVSGRLFNDLVENLSTKFSIPSTYIDDIHIVLKPSSTCTPINPQPHTCPLRSPRHRMLTLLWVRTRRSPGCLLLPQGLRIS